MPYEIRFLEESGIIAIENKGEITQHELLKQTQEAIQMGREKKSDLFLTIFSHVKVQAGTFDVARFPDMYEQLGMKRTSRIAVVVSEVESKAEDLRFYETICLNRGWHIKIFLEKDPALEWLVEGKGNVKQTEPST